MTPENGPAAAVKKIRIFRGGIRRGIPLLLLKGDFQTWTAPRFKPVIRLFPNPLPVPLHWQPPQSTNPKFNDRTHET